MPWEKKICFRLTMRRIVVAILAASTVANLIIVGVVFGADAPPAPAITSVLTTSLSPPTLLIPISAGEETATLTSTQIPGITPADPFTPTLTSTDSLIWIVCVRRLYWPTYHVQPGDTLFSLALSTGSTVRDLISANCLTNDQIYAGQLLYVPRLLSNTFTPTPTSTSTFTPTPSATPSITPTYTLTATQTPTNTPTVTPSITPTNTPTYTLPPPADLVVTVIQVAGPAEIRPAEETIAIPIHILIQNQGGSDAEIFKLSAHYTGRVGTFVAPFTVSGQADIWYPYSTAPLAVGHEVAFTGTISLPITLQGQTIALSVLVDSCSGDQSMPAYCRVDEGNENNNESQPFTVRLPSNYPPSVVITVPDADKSYVYGDQVLLQGSATDLEDGDMSGSALAWSSDGSPLGTGTEVDVTTYYLKDTCGASYVFTLTATDRGGNVATARRQIDITCPLN